MRTSNLVYRKVTPVACMSDSLTWLLTVLLLLFTTLATLTSGSQISSSNLKVQQNVAATESKPFRLLSRSRRNVETTSVSEDSTRGSTLYDLNRQSVASPVTDYSFEIVGATDGVSTNLFRINNYQLQIYSSATDTEMDAFDREKNQVISVQLLARKLTDPDQGQEVSITVEITLDDINDETPEFTNPSPYQATVATDAPSGTIVYVVTAYDPDVSADLRFELDAGSSDRFDIAQQSNTNIANVITKGSDPFITVEYRVQISVRDIGASPEQRKSMELSVTTASLAPQFYSTNYVGQVYEASDQQIVQKLGESESLLIQVIQFQTDSSLTFVSDNSNFEVVPDATNTDRITLRCRQALDYETIQSVTFKVEARESTGLTSTATVTVSIIDENDSTPEFISKTQYFEDIKEDTAPDTTIFSVSATDADSGNNGKIKFSVVETNAFYVDTVEPAAGSGSKVYIGNVKVRSREDINFEANKSIAFQIVATDESSETRKSSTAYATVTIINVNDNPPEIDSVRFTVPSGAGPGYVVTILAASDVDGDNIKFYFDGLSDTSGIFRIDQQSGTLTLQSTVPTDQDAFELNVVTVDDNSCCTPVSGSAQTSTTVVTVVVEDANNFKPDFVDCSAYNSAEVAELAAVGTTVVQVSAQDNDRGENAVVTYSLSNSNDSPFQINAADGLITVRNQDSLVRDRDSNSYVQVTVIGTNEVGLQSLTGYCTFRVTIVDINNHAPQFDQSQYSYTYQATSNLPWIITQMLATDDDFGENAAITYTLDNKIPDFSDAFTINSVTGVLQINNALTEGAYSMTVVANDNGNPTALTGTTTVIITVSNDQFDIPSWVGVTDYSPSLPVSEAAPVGTTLITFQCQSNADNPQVEFHVFDTAKTINDPSDFFEGVTIEPPSGSVIYTLEVKLKAQLDYLTDREHSLTATCQGFSGINIKAREIIITINVQDANNQVPRLQGMDPNSGRFEATVVENSPQETSVRTVRVFDEDEDPSFKVITFSLKEQDAASFTIRKTSSDGFEATVYTAQTFDRETKDTYNFEIVASDGVNSDEVYMTVLITDANDMIPVFDETSYTFEVPESAEINDVVGIVKATDGDTIDAGIGLEYVFETGNINNAFTILFGLGEIRLARKLDYDQGDKVYTMLLRAYDDNRLHSASTSVTINVLDENDTPPKFDQKEYTIIGLVEEEDTSVTADNPKFLVRVRATDSENRPETAIRYSLAASSDLFIVDDETGDVYLIGALDRDGPVPETRVTIRAADELVQPLYDYADVVVFPIDINDNAPQFEQCCISFTVPEHTARDVYVGQLLARDADEGANSDVKYYLADNQPSTNSNFFRVSLEGDIYTNVDPSALDYETVQSVDLLVEARDSGADPQITLQTVTINLKDINDQLPYFEEPLYTTRMSERTTSGPILQVLAKDADTASENRNFVFSIQPEYHFIVSKDEDYAVISVNGNNPIDYEVDDHYYKFTLTVTDSPDSGRSATTSIEVFVDDYNDNAPVFSPDKIGVTLADGLPRGTSVANFSASDRDDGINAEFEYSIDPNSDPFFEFYVEPFTGEVMTRKELDRELADSRNLFIMAIDKGEIPLTGTATLTVTLTDINDNAPVFAEDYLPVVPENEDNNNRVVVEIFARDPDTRQYGPPFGFALVDGCSACAFFSLTYNPDRDGGNGTATITTSTRFDREVQKEYHLPIIMWDMNGINSGNAMTGTNTLTIIIGDKNDNRHTPGHQAITYNDFGAFSGDTIIGRVYAADEDDWDLPDKTFTYVSPEIYTNYFSVHPETGEITIKDGVPANSGGEPYRFEVDVYDKVYQNTERCTVDVTVKVLTDEAIRKAGSVRLSGITAAEFIVPGGPSVPGAEVVQSKMDVFKQEMARILQYPGPDNIEVVALTDGPGYLDVRFSGHSSPYVTPSQMESALMLNLDSVENAAGITVAQVPINLCMEEKYLVGCYTDLELSAEPQAINANGTSLTTVVVSAEAKDGCPDVDFPNPVECRGDYCYNGGTCRQDDWGKLSCDCLVGFDGPRCQQRRHSFDGNSGTFYSGLSPCAEGRTSIEFITLESDGLIMFSGPIVDIDPNANPQDYMVLELKSGYPQLRLNLGVGELMLTLNGQDGNGQILMPQLNDGQWHKFDIDREDQDVVLTVDHCRYATADENGTVADWTPCRAQGRVPGGDILLNVQSLLQLGKRYPASSPPSFPADVPTQGFIGCLKNLFHNAKLYDLYYRPIVNWNSGDNGCPREEGICGLGNNPPECGDHAHCQSRWSPDQVEACTCEPGWYGDKCSSVAPIMDLKDDSFFQWELSSNLLNEAVRSASMQLMFRSRQESGSLFVITNVDQNRIDLQLEGGEMLVRYNLGQGDQTLKLSGVVAADGAWHVARLERYGSEFQMTLDGGEGRLYTYRQPEEDASVLFSTLPYMSAGARIATQNPGSISDSSIASDLVDTCVQDVRFNDMWLPFSETANSGPEITLLEGRNIMEGCTRDDCAGITCPTDRYCKSLWEAYECACVTGLYEVDDVCVTTCQPNPCFNNAPCSVDNGGSIVCTCPADFTGQYCNIGSVSDGDDGLATSALIGIILGIILLIALIIILVVIFLTCRKTDAEKNILEVDPDDDFIRENVMYYDEEGAGEEDHEAYDITLLQKNAEAFARPNIDPVKEDDMRRRNEPRLDRPDVGSFIDSRIRDTENDDEPMDVPQEFNFEGNNSDAGSLSSLNTSSSGGSQDYDYLNDWGPKFARLADMYGAGQNLES